MMISGAAPLNVCEITGIVLHIGNGKHTLTLF